MTDIEVARQLLVNIMAATSYPQLMTGVLAVIGIAVGLRRGGWL